MRRSSDSDLKARPVVEPRASEAEHEEHQVRGDLRGHVVHFLHESRFFSKRNDRMTRGQVLIAKTWKIRRRLRMKIPRSAAPICCCLLGRRWIGHCDKRSPDRFLPFKTSSFRDLYLTNITSASDQDVRCTPRAFTRSISRPSDPNIWMWFRIRKNDPRERWTGYDDRLNVLRYRRWCTVRND